MSRIVTKFTTRKAKKVSNNAYNKALKEVAIEMEKAMKAQMKKQFPPASKPGQIPRVRTGQLKESIRVTASRGSIKVRSVDHGLFLETGTSRMSPRPWALRVLGIKTRRGPSGRTNKWAKKIAKRALELTGGKKKRGK